MYELTKISPLSVEVVRTDQKPTLEELQSFVGGFIERVPDFNLHGNKRAIAYCNGDGIAKRLPVNEAASALWWMQFDTTQLLRGNVIIITTDTKEEFEQL
jgi:hypothetical protein